MASAKRKSASRDRAIPAKARTALDKAFDTSVDPKRGSHYIRLKYEVLLYFEEEQQGIDPHGPLCRPIAVVHYGLQKVVPKHLHKGIKVIDGRFEAKLFKPKVKKAKAPKAAPKPKKVSNVKNWVCRDPMCPGCDRRGHGRD